MNSSGPVKVLHLITELSTGGAQMVLYNLLCSLDRQRFDPIVACYYNADGSIARRIRSLGIPVVDLGMTGKVRLDAFWRLYRLLNKEKPHILHTWMFHANIPGRVIGRLARVPGIISSEHTMGQEGRERLLLDRLTSPWADRVICVSQEVACYAESSIHIPSRKLVVIPNGIDLERFLNLPSQDRVRAAHALTLDAVIIGAIGRLHPVKGYPVLLHAYSQIANDYPETQLIFIGDGPDRQRLQELTQQLGLSARVVFLGNQDNISDILPALDLLAQPSLYEGLPMVLLEAMAAGLPVIGTRTGGVPDLVLDGETGLLVPPSDPASLAQALAKLIADPDLRKRLGTAGRERVQQQYSLRDSTARTMQLYQEVLAEKLL